MASYFRNLFSWGNSRSSHSSSQPTAGSSKSHSRSYLSSTVPSSTANYIYASSGSSHVSAVPPPVRAVPSKPSMGRASSYSHPHTATPSPLRYPTSDSRSRSHSRDRDYSRPKTSSSAPDSKASQAQIYGRHPYKSKDHHVHYAQFVQSGYGTAGSSRSNSSSSIYANMPPSAPLSSSSRHNIVAPEPPATRPQLKQNHTWHAGAGVSTSATSHSSSHGRSSSRSLLQTSAIHMHPLFAYTRLHHAPISYDITASPSARTVLDRTTHSPVPAHTLAQPATEPPIPASSTLVLRSDKIPWRITVGPIGAQPSSGSLGKASGRAISTGTACITNLDVLYALHNGLMKRVTTAEWESLGNGSRAQRKVATAYEKRCLKQGGGWEHGIRRVDWLSSKTRLVGVEVAKGENSGGCVGTMIFGKA